MTVFFCFVFFVLFLLLFFSLDERSVPRNTKKKSKTVGITHGKYAQQKKTYDCKKHTVKKDVCTFLTAYGLEGMSERYLWGRGTK